MIVFEYLVFLDETRDADGKITAPGEIVVDVSRLLAKNQSQADQLVARLVPTEVIEDPAKFDRLFTVVRPF